MATMDANATGEDALKDDDGDVVMIDIDDPAEINQIAEDLHTSRALTQTKRPSQWTDRLRQKVHSEVDTVVLVDTNFIISHLSTVSKLVTEALSRTVLILIPWVVIQELDKLKVARIGKGQADLDHLARQAIRYIHAQLNSGQSALRGQKPIESIDPDTFGDEAILDCANYWHSKHSHNIVLLSNDINLCSKFIIVGYKAISYRKNLTCDAITSAKAEEQKGPCSAADSPAERSIHAESADTHPLSSKRRIDSSSIVHRKEMEVDSAIAPLWSKDMEDPFEALAAKAGRSRYESPPLSNDRRDSIDLNKLPPKHSTDNAQGQLSWREICIDITKTLEKALPRLIHERLLRELGSEEYVAHVMHGLGALDDKLSLAELLTIVRVNHFTLFAQPTLPLQKSDMLKIEGICKTLDDRLSTIDLPITRCQQLADDAIYLWRALSNDQNDKYVRRRDSWVRRWQM